MTEPTYGELLDASERFLVEAALASKEKLLNAKAAIDAAQGHANFMKALRANLRVFAELPSVDDEPHEQQAIQPHTDLARALDAFVEWNARDEHPQSDDGQVSSHWTDAARALHAAADTLRTHLGHERAYRTPDAAVLDDEHARQAAARRLAEMTLTTGTAQHRLALRIREFAAARENLGSLRTRAAHMLLTHETLTAAAARAIASQARTPIPEALGFLRAAPLLRPTRIDDPISSARQAFDRIRLIAHRQVRDELPAGIDAIRAYTTVATLVTMHAHAIFAAASVAGDSARSSHVDETQLRVTADALHDAAGPWNALAAATERCASTRRSPRLLAHEIGVLADGVTAVTRDNGRWRAPDDLLPNQRTANRRLRVANHLVSRLPELAHATGALAHQLHAHGDMLMPTRERNDIDHPYRWASINAERLTAILSAITRAQAASRYFTQEHEHRTHQSSELHGVLGYRVREVQRGKQFTATFQLL